jgi:hypothetical protein
MKSPFASGERFFRIFAGIFILPLLSTEYEYEPLNDDIRTHGFQKILESGRI